MKSDQQQQPTSGEILGAMLGSILVRWGAVLLAWNLGVHGVTNEPAINAVTALGLLLVLALLKPSRKAG